ncbi:unannotated protein [freshwater metagenome]|uniref:Unannotated protein n=1 Tax=freshwater metagenome TaxID=449393 RepID=A0A6J6C988_9ZZZZ
MTIRDFFEVRANFRLLGEVFRPVIGRFERIAIEVVADINTTTGIGVLVPSATHPSVLLDDGERNTGLFESDASKNTGLPCSDHHYWQRSASLGR